MPASPHEFFRIGACRVNNGTRSGGLPTDNFLNNPEDCGFDPASLQRLMGDGPDCLTAPQVEALQAMYDGVRNPRTGERIYFGFPGAVRMLAGSSLACPAGACTGRTRKTLPGQPAPASGEYGASRTRAGAGGISTTIAAWRRWTAS